MIEIVKELYDLDVLMIYSISSKTYKLKSKGEFYILKYIDGYEKLDGIVNRIRTLGLEEFDYIIPNKYGSYISSVNGYNFYLSYYYEESNTMEEMKLKLYIDAIAKLHNKTFYTINVNNDFFLETYDYIEDRLINVSDKIDRIVESIEREDYKSPFGWMLILNYGYLKRCMDKSYEYLERFKRKSKDKDSIRMVFGYLNFDFKHIMIKDNRVVSIEKMKNAPPIFDIVNMVEHCYSSSISIVSIIERYLSKFKLNDYEQSWLLSILYIPMFNFDKVDDVEKIKSLVDCLEYCKCIESIDKNMQNKN